MPHQSDLRAKYRAFMAARAADNARTYGDLETGALSRVPAWINDEESYVSNGETFFDARHPRVACEECGEPTHEFFAYAVSGIGMCKKCHVDLMANGSVDDDFFYTGIVVDHVMNDRAVMIGGVRHCPACMSHVGRHDTACRAGHTVGCGVCDGCETAYCPACGRYHEDNDPRSAYARHWRAVEAAESRRDDLVATREHLGYYD